MVTNKWKLKYLFFILIYILNYRNIFFASVNFFKKILLHRGSVFFRDLLLKTALLEGRSDDVALGMGHLRIAPYHTPRE